MDWNAMAAPWLKWEAEIEATHRTVLDALMMRAAPQAGQSVLDIGGGSGASVLRAADAVGPMGRVLGVDIAPPLAERAQSRAPGHVTIAVGDAETHEFEPESVDLVQSLFGMMFFNDTGAAFANIRRAVKPGGKLHMAAWAAPPNNPWFGVPRGVAEARLGPVPKGDPLAPGPFAFADSARVLGLLEGAGWRAEVETVDLDLMPPGSPAEIAAQQSDMGAAALVMREKDASAADRAAIVADLTAALEAMVRDGRVHVPAQLHFFSAVA